MTRWFVWESSSAPPLVLRRHDHVDELFRDGSWRPTKAIVDWNFGHNDWVTEIDESEARRLLLGRSIGGEVPA